MTTKHGFKLYSLRLFEETRRTELDFDAAGFGPEGSQKGFSQYFSDLLADIKPHRFRGELSQSKLRISLDNGDRAALPTEADAKENEPVIDILEVEQKPRFFEITFRTGVSESHEHALGSTTEEDVDLKGLAPSNVFRAFLFLPTQGTEAVLATQTRGRFAPGLRLCALLNYASLLFDHLDPVGHKRGWWRLSHKQIADSDRLENNVNKGKAVAVRLTRYRISKDGKRSSASVRLTQEALPASKVGQATRTVNSWFTRTRDDDPSKIDSTGDVEDFFEVDVKSDEFHEAHIQFEHPDGTPRWYSPESFNDKFTYPVHSTDTVPTVDELRRAVVEKVREQNKIQGFQLDL